MMLSNLPPGVKPSDFDDPDQVDIERIYEDLAEIHPDYSEDELYEMAINKLNEEKERFEDEMYEAYDLRLKGEF
jgi:hypothetical protein